MGRRRRRNNQPVNTAKRYRIIKARWELKVKNKQPIMEIGSNKSIKEQQAEVIKALEGEQLLENSFEKKMSEKELNYLAEQQNKKGVTQLFEKDGIGLKTELTGQETVLFSQLMFITDRYKIKGADQFINNMLELKVSLNRKGRREFIEGLHAEERREQNRDLSPFQAIMQKLGGG